MKRCRNLLLLNTMLFAAACGSTANAELSSESASEDAAAVSLARGDDPNACGAPKTLGAVNPNSAICGEQRVPVYVDGAFTGTVSIVIQSPDANTTIGTMQHEANTCAYAYLWQLPRGAQAGAYTLKVADANEDALSFVVYVDDPNHCGRRGGGEFGGDDSGGLRGGNGGCGMSTGRSPTGTTTGSVGSSTGGAGSTSTTGTVTTTNQ